MENLSQGRDEVVIDAPARTVFSVLQDSIVLPRWMPMVKATTGKREVSGSIRECEVSFAGKEGQVTEKCIDCVPNKRIAWLLVKDTLGFNKMLEDFSFSFELIEKGENKTLVVNESFFKPKNFMAKIMVWLMIKRKFHQVRMTALTNLKKFSEEIEHVHN